MTDGKRDLGQLNALLDLHGSEFSAWPDAEAAQWSRKLVLANPEARPALDEARQLDALLRARADAFREDQALVERTVAAVGQALPARRGETRAVLIRLAASFLLAGMIGSAMGQAIQPVAGPDEAELAMLESLLYGPDEVELQ